MECRGEGGSGTRVGVLDACVKRFDWECKLIEVYFKFVCANGAIRSNPGDKFSITRLKAQCRCSKALWGEKGQQLMRCSFLDLQLEALWTLEGESSRHPSVPTGSYISKNRVGQGWASPVRVQVDRDGPGTRP